MQGLMRVLVLLMAWRPMEGLNWCPPGWILYGDECYVINDSHGVTWHQAKHICNAANATMVEICSNEHQEFINGHITRDIWIGLHDHHSEGNFVWDSDNSTLSGFTNWGSGEPSNGEEDCGTWNGLWNGNGRWNDYQCTWGLKYFCQKPKGSQNCSDDWLPFEGSCYWHSTAKLPWQQAREDCQAKDGDLVVIRSYTEVMFLRTLQPRALFWIGLNDLRKEGEWRWLDENSPLNFSYWYFAQPDNAQNGPEDCAQIWPNVMNSGRWTSNPCQMSLPSFCERPSDNGTCGEDFVTYNGRCLLPGVGEFFPWDAAREACRRHDADMMTLRSRADVEIVQRFIRTRTWIGLRRRQDTRAWVWLDEEEPANYTRWSPGQPMWSVGPHCVYVHATSHNLGQWQNEACHKWLNFVCETQNHTGECTAPWVLHNQHCYYVSTNVSNWADARVKCKQMAGDRLEKWTDLVTIEEADEQNFVQDLIAGSRSLGYWIALAASPGDEILRWPDGTEPVWSNWSPGMPLTFYAESCVEVTGHIQKRGKWNDMACSRYNGFSCQAPTYTSHYDFSDANYVYKFIPHALSWPDASTFCKSYLGPLATLANITSQKHWRHLQSYLSRVYPERDITIWIHQSNVSTQQSTKTVTVDGIVRGSSTGCMNILKSHQDTLSPSYVINAQPCCQEAFPLCQRQAYDNEDAYDFTWNTTAFKLQSSETPLSTSQCQQRCQDVLQGYGAVFMVTSSEELVVIEHALNHTKDPTQKYYVTFNITDHTFPRHLRSPREGSCWALSANMGRTFTIANVIDNVTSINCDDIKHFICARSIDTDAKPSQNSSKKAVDDNESEHSETITHSSQVQIHPTVSGCNKLCKGLIVAVVVMTLVIVAIFALIYLYFMKPHLLQCFRKSGDDTIRLT